jgi:hypothetical protein
MRRHQIGQLPAEDMLESGIIVDPLGVQQLSAGDPTLE